MLEDMAIVDLGRNKDRDRPEPVIDNPQVTPSSLALDLSFAALFLIQRGHFRQPNFCAQPPFSSNLGLTLPLGGRAVERGADTKI